MRASRYRAGFLFCLLISFAAAIAREQEPRSILIRSEEGITVVVCDPGDPYHPLAVEICRAESIRCLETLEQALDLEPRFLLWVGSPAFFSDRILVQSGSALGRRHAATAIGILSGATIEDARALWQRRTRTGSGRIFAVNGEYPPARIFSGRILTPAAGGMAERPLTRQSLIEVLQDADYVTFTGHGGGSYWRLAQGLSFTAPDLPPLPPLVIGVASCQAIRLNTGSSMAFALVARGAAGYAGFLFSPLEGYLIGEFSGLPFRYTWPGVTIGEVIRIQNRGAMQGFAAFPYYLLLGDPRISLQPDADWSPLGIESYRGVRTLLFGDTPPGFYPIRIRNGARYSFVEIPGFAAASDTDPFYNSRLQMINSGSDKLVLMQHAGGDLKISMRVEPPRFWRISDPLLDALDHTLLYLPATGGKAVNAIVIILALLGIYLLLRREKKPAQILRSGMLAGIVMGLGHVLYAMSRTGSATITSKPIGVGVTEILVTTMLAGCGMILFLKARSRFLRVTGVAVAVLPGLGASLVSFGAVFVTNNLFAGPALAASIYNYSLTILALIGTAFQTAFFACLALLIGRLTGR